ncbi:hypothetical protein BMS3Bbin09_00556 [bacterium BMS3Bbin09]|nr:hypothetical protein BMS3Bbin09_00556 [bacterium BMS3Bbin09]
MLCPGRVIKEKLGHRVHMVLRFKKQLPDLVPDLRTARLCRLDHIMPFGAKVLCKGLYLRALARSLNAFKRYKTLSF